MVPSAPAEAGRRVFSDDAIRDLVHAFYGQVRADTSLGPVFDRRIRDWPAHLDRMVLFWRSVLRGEVGYEPERGSPLELHRAIAELTHDHFVSWLGLFEATAHEIFEPSAARLVVGKARRMAVSLSAHLGPTRPDLTRMKELRP
jgi:hemoglobin